MIQARVSFDIISSISEFKDNSSELWIYLRTFYHSNNDQRHLMRTETWLLASLMLLWQSMFILRPYRCSKHSLPLLNISPLIMILFTIHLRGSSCLGLHSSQISAEIRHQALLTSCRACRLTTLGLSVTEKSLCGCSHLILPKLWFPR